jgi:hypothetical protein
MASEGEAGRSAREQFEKRVATSRAKRIDFFGPRFGKFLNFLIGDSTSTAAWRKGASGEAAVGEFLSKFAAENDFYVLHDRAIPGSKANIDHLLISDRGVFVIDAKNYTGLIQIRGEGNFFNSREVLYVGNRNQSKLVDGVKKQVLIVANALAKLNSEIPVTGMLAFVEADFPILFKPQAIDGVLINSKGISSSVFSKAVIKGIDLAAIANFLKKAFPAKI